MSYLYEMHLHTKQASACASSRGSEYVKVYQDLGYSGIFVTDHFMHGNNCIDRGLPWDEWVNCFCKGYEDALNEGIRRGFDVFFAWEESFNGDDYLIYGLDKKWLLEHPQAGSWTRKEQYEAVTGSGGCVVQAHPFRQADYLRQICLSTGCVDGVEAANACNGYAAFDALAMRYGQKFGFTLTAGSDIHNVGMALDKKVYGVYIDEKLESAKDYARIVRARKIKNLKIPKGRCDFKGDEEVTLAVEIRDKNDNPAGGNWRKLLDM